MQSELVSSMGRALMEHRATHKGNEWTCDLCYEARAYQQATCEHPSWVVQDDPDFGAYATCSACDDVDGPPERYG